MSINIFKFGGVSVGSAPGVRNVVEILLKFSHEPLLVVVSAMGKTTNALEELLSCFQKKDPLKVIRSFRKVEDYHWEIVRELFADNEHPVYGEVDSIFNQLRGYIRKGHLFKTSAADYDFDYDQIVSYGELLSSSILFNYFLECGGKAIPADARDLIKTDATYRDARVNWELTSELIRNNLLPVFNDNGNPATVVITQGFIGSDPNGNTTTLGREGSDFSGAIFAWSLKAKEMTVWKDVPGVMNGDPKWMKDAVRLETLSYREAVELAYYGASVIHPKTIKPLENADIVLKVKSFSNPDMEGTRIENIKKWKIPFPIFIRKVNQVLISVSPRDFSFIIEENLSEIFSILARFRVKANVMQNSAISFSVCVDADNQKIPKLIEFLNRDYETRYNENLKLYTIRHYNDKAIGSITANRTVLMELRSRNTVQIVLK